MKRRSLLVLLVVSLIVLTSVLYISTHRKPSSGTGREAVIVDGLSDEFPNPMLIRDVINLLEGEGYQVDVYNCSSVTVEFYGSLPSMGYELILLRIHSAPMDGGSKPGAALFTYEPPPGKYMVEQLMGWVRIARTLTRGDRFYAVTPSFMREGMEGEFDHTVLFMMSCYGFVDDTLPKIFIEKGASAFVGWTERVTPEHMDRATLILLEKMLVEGFSMIDAVRYTMEEVGADPSYGGRLDVYTQNMKSR